MRPIQRKTRASLPHTQAGIEDISYLNLGEVRNRLERNERVLNTALFSGSPPAAGGAAGFSTSPTASTIARPGQTGQTGVVGVGSPPSAPDPFREKLLQARQALLAREKELLMEQEMSKMEVGEYRTAEGGGQGLTSSSAGGVGRSPIAESSLDARRRSSGAGGAGGQMGMGNGARYSGKAMAMEAIQAGEVALHPNGIILPYAETLALGERDYENATINKISNLSLQSPARTTTAAAPNAAPSKRYDPTDEIARARSEANARMQSFMSYKAREDDDQGEEGMFEDDYAEEGEYDGEGDRFELGPQGREPHFVEPGTGEPVDEFGEDSEDWPEGNDDYLDSVR